MSQKRKRGLQRGLSEIVEAQTATPAEKSQLSRGLIDKFADKPEPKQTPATQGTQGSEGSRPQPVAPARDFMRVANSITRTALPAGVFTGKSKQIYLFLYSKTRGAVVPARTAQLSRREIMAGANVGSDKTLRENLLRLRASGLVSWAERQGAHGGNTYTVLLPEEAATPATQGTEGSPGYPGQNLPTVPAVETTQGTQGSLPVASITSGAPKTSFKTKDQTTDDEATRRFAELLRNAERELTGKNSSFGSQWAELAELLVAELKIAAARTGQVSSVPAFLTEHLRRRLWKKSREEVEREARDTPVTTKQGQGLDASACPDCRGTGWWYPQGEEKGVAKCRHARLQHSTDAGESR